MRMCKCTAKIVWEWEEQCFAAEYVWEFMSFCENCWERFCKSCWERFCESYWGSRIQVAKGVRVVDVLFTCWRCESFLLLLFFEYVPKQSTRVMGLRHLFICNLIFTNTSQNRQNILLLFFEYVPKQSTKVMGLRHLFICNLIFTYTSQNRQNIETWPISQTWPNRHDHCQTCKPLKIESLRLGFTFSKPSLTDSSLKCMLASTWHLRGTQVFETRVPRRCRV